MPRFRVTEHRLTESTFIVEAEDEQAAKTSTNMVEEESESDSWSYEIVSAEEIEE